MNGPWEDFQASSTEEDGPWAEFKSPQEGLTGVGRNVPVPLMSPAGRDAKKWTARERALLEKGDQPIPQEGWQLPGQALFSEPKEDDGVPWQDKLFGAAETAAWAATGALAQGTGLIGGADAYIRKKLAGQPTSFEDEYVKSMERQTFEPRGIQGREYTKPIGDFLNQNLVPIAPMIFSFGGRPGTKSKKPSTVDRLKQNEPTPKPETGPMVQGDLFPETLTDTTGYASPYDASTIGTTEPITPKRARAQQELPLRNDLPETINVDREGVTLRPEDMAVVEAAKNAELARLDQEAAPIIEQQRRDALLNARQEEMWATDHSGDLAPSGEMVPRAPTPELTQQGELFAPQTNMHRAYTDLRLDDGLGGERPLTKTEFEQTLTKLEQEKGTAFTWPEDVDAAYADYMNSVRNPSLFDTPARVEAYKAAAARKEASKGMGEASLEKAIKPGSKKKKGFIYGQVGAFDISDMNLGFGGLQKRLSKLTDILAQDLDWQYRMIQSLGGKEYVKNSDGSPKVLLHGTIENIQGPLRSSEEGFHAGTAPEGHIIVQKGNRKGWFRPGQTRENAQMHPIVLREGNYPKIPYDAMNWDPKKIVNEFDLQSPRYAIRRYIEDALANKGYTDSQIKGLFNYVTAKTSIKDKNEAFSDVLKRADIDGFFYTNKAESPRTQKLLDSKSTPLRDKIARASENPTSFVTWNDRNFKSIFDLPQTPTNTTGRQAFGQLNSGFDPTNAFKGFMENAMKYTRNLSELLPQRGQVLTFRNDPGWERRQGQKFIVDTVYQDEKGRWKVDGKLYDKSGNDIESTKFYPKEGSIDFEFVNENRHTFHLSNFKETAKLGADLLNKRDPFKGSGGTQLYSGFDPTILFKSKVAKDTLTKLENTFIASEDGTFIPQNPDTARAIEEALKQGKDGKQWNMLQSGSTSVAMKTGSPIIQAASRIVQNGLKRADLLIRNTVFPAEQSMKRLSKQEIADLADIFKEEVKMGKRFNGDNLASALSVKQLEAYVAMRRMFDDALDAQNAARLDKGKNPINPMEAYMSSRWQGDFRRPIYDKDGKLVWYLAANTKGGLETQTKALLKDFPDLVVDKKKDHVVRSTATKSDLESMYTKMLDLLGRDDPAIQKIKQAIEEQTVAQGEGMLGQEKHFKRKAGIRGFVGDRPGTNPVQEAVDMFRQQIQYAKNAYRWSEMQKAADEVKAITSDPRLQEQQPNNIKYIREYFKNAAGMGEGQMARLLDDYIRDGLGVSPTVVNNAVGDVKSFFILQKLAASTGYTAANLIQTSNVLPYLAQMMGTGYRGNPVSAVMLGVPEGMAMATWHYARKLGETPALPNQFMADAFKYAEDNGVISRSVYDESPIDTNSGVVGATGRVAGQTMVIPEAVVRSIGFMTYANMLKSSGKFKNQSELFQKAEEYVNMSLVDYRETERPLMFSKAGMVGNFLNTLQTFPISFYNQYAFMAKQAREGNPWGLATMLAVHYSVAGVMGVPGFDDAEKLYKWMRDNALPTETWAKVMKSPFFADPKLWMMENMGKESVYGMLSEKTGIGLTSRIAAPGGGAMLQSPAGPITDIASQIGNVAKLAIDPTNKEKWAQVGMSSAPVGLQGLLETRDFMKDYTFVERSDGTKVFMKTKDIADRKGGYARTPQEVQMRAWGLRSQKEVVERDVSYATSSALQTQAKKSGELIDRYYSAIRRGDTKKANELNELYIDLTGSDGIKDRDLENQIKEEFMTDVERSNSAINTINKAKAMARMNKILENSK